MAFFQEVWRIFERRICVVKQVISTNVTAVFLKATYDRNEKGNGNLWAHSVDRVDPSTQKKTQKVYSSEN